ncbi:MAG: TIGR03618 family F420-dependent PPOX class oxidoreductase [Chloroflexi bacterium]|nr:TIGR03618 family F420-dependent PPOX class oxidoreductase [Chloroflexota bacterium]
MDFNDATPFLTEQHSAVVTTVRPSGAAQSTIVRAGPYLGRMAFVVQGNTAKLRNLARNPHCTVLTVTPDWRRYATVEGQAELRTPDNTDAQELRLILRAVFIAAGGTHDNWDEFDRVMKEERRAAVLVTPDRVYGRV